MAAPQFELMHDLLGLAGARWTIEVLSVLRENRMRFNEIAHAVEGISQSS